jgi:hypothetical protein
MTYLMDTRDNSTNHPPSKAPDRPRTANTAPPARGKLTQFNWRLHWTKKVVPYLHEPLVQASLNFGMRLLDRNWKPGDAPCDYGAVGPGRTVRGELAWYQPLNRSHSIAFFSMAIGVLNAPELDWQFVSGDLHTIPVGYDADGGPRVVMDILLFDGFTAEQSLAHTRLKGSEPSPDVREDRDSAFDFFVTEVVPLLKARAQELPTTRDGHPSCPDTTTRDEEQP